jgi:hypothetical protein
MDNGQLINRLLTVIEQDIVPKTQLCITQGNNVFGVANLKKSDFSVIIDLIQKIVSFLPRMNPVLSVFRR